MGDREAIARSIWRAYSGPNAGDHDDDGWEGGGEHYEPFWAMADAVLPFVAEAFEAGRVVEREHLRTQIEALSHGWVETGVDDGQGHREGFEATEWTRLLAVFAVPVTQEASDGER